MNMINNRIKSSMVAGALMLGLLGTAQAQQMMPQGMMPQGMMPQGMMPQGMMPQQMMPQGMMPQQMMPQGMMPQGMMPQQRQVNPLAMLKLNEEQQKQLKDIAAEAQKQGMGFMKRMGESSLELQKLMTGDKLNAKTIGDAYAEIFKIQRQMIESGVTNYNKELAVFTQEQRKMWDTMRKQMQGANPIPR